MALTYKVLGQVSPAAITNTDLYTTPAATSTVASTLTVCNRGSTTTIRVAVRPAGVALSVEHYILFDTAISSNDTLFLTIGMSLSTTDVVTVYSLNGLCSFNLFGSEIV